MFAVIMISQKVDCVAFRVTIFIKMEKKCVSWAKVAEQAGVNQDSDFTWYFRDGTKKMMLNFTWKQNSMAQYLIERLKITPQGVSWRKSQNELQFAFPRRHKRIDASFRLSRNLNGTVFRRKVKDISQIYVMEKITKLIVTCVEVTKRKSCG